LFLRFSRVLAAILVVVAGLSVRVLAEPVPATFKQGSLHGFLLLRSQDGKVIAIGDETNVVRGNEIRSELKFRFRDGSIDDDITDYRQGKVFQLIRDHHIQKGPSFPKPLDMTVNVAGGEVKWTETKDGKNDTKSQHMDLPNDLVNGMMQLAVEDFPAGAAELKTSYLAADPKPRLVQLSIKPDGEDRIQIGGAGRRAKRYNIHIEIGGLAGAIAPVIGKQPSDMKLWVLEGEAPLLIRMEGALYPTGPVWTMALTSPSWPSNPQSK
jgi:hypothetical protein